MTRRVVLGHACLQIRPAKPRPERYAARPIGADAHHQHAVRPGDESLARDRRVAQTITHFGDSSFHVQLAAIVGEVGGSEGKQQVADGLVGLLRLGYAPEMVVGHFLGLLELVRRKPDRESAGNTGTLRVVVIMRTARPEGRFVERDPFLRHAAKDHGPDHAVAQGHRLEPGRCGRRYQSSMSPVCASAARQWAAEQARMTVAKRCPIKLGKKIGPAGVSSGG